MTFNHWSTMEHRRISHVLHILFLNMLSLQVEQPQKFRIYREMAVNAIAEALDGSLNDEKIRKKCCRALLILCGHFSSTGMITTRTSILKQAGYNNGSSELKYPGHDDDEDQQLDITISLVSFSFINPMTTSVNMDYLVS